MDGLKKMEILIEQITEEGLVFEFEKSAENFPVLAEMAANGECKFAAPIGTNLRALRIGDMVEIDGDIETSVRLPCSRYRPPAPTSRRASAGTASRAR